MFFTIKTYKFFLNLILIIISIILVLCVNLAFSYKLMNMIEYGDKSYDGIIDEIKKIFEYKKLDLICFRFFETF